MWSSSLSFLKYVKPFYLKTRLSFTGSKAFLADPAKSSKMKTTILAKILSEKKLWNSISTCGVNLFLKALKGNFIMNLKFKLRGKIKKIKKGKHEKLRVL